MLCFDTFCGCLHKLDAATIDGKGRVGRDNFSHDGGGAQMGSCPHPAGAVHALAAAEQQLYH